MRITDGLPLDATTIEELYSSSAAVFFDAERGVCRNTAYSSIIWHETGHYLEHAIKGSIEPDAFAEGFADSVSILGLNDPAIGRWMWSQRIYNRQPLASHCKYGIFGGGNDPLAPWAHCEIGAHSRGQVLGGIWTGILNGMIAKYGAMEGLERARQLHVNWMLLTAGGDPPGTNEESAHPGTLIEVLIANMGSDGFMPDCQIILDAFAHHNLTCNEDCPPCG